MLRISPRVYLQKEAVLKMNAAPGDVWVSTSVWEYCGGKHERELVNWMWRNLSTPKWYHQDEVVEQKSSQQVVSKERLCSGKTGTLQDLECVALVRVTIDLLGTKWTAKMLLVKESILVGAATFKTVVGLGSCVLSHGLCSAVIQTRPVGHFCWLFCIRNELLGQPRVG